MHDIDMEPGKHDIRGSEPSGKQEKWTTVVKRGVKQAEPQKRIVVNGKNINKDSKLKTVPKKAFLFVTRLDPTTTSNMLTDFVKDIFPEVICDSLESKYPEYYSSFKVTINMENLDKALNPDLWPAGVLVTRDLGRIDTQHAMHVTGSVNRLRPVERSQCERKCHSAMEQRVNIKFCYKLGKTATETHGMLVQVYGREAVSRKCVYEWFKRFREGKETIEDEPRSGRPSTSRTPEMIEKVRQVLEQDRRLTLRSIAEELDISKDTVHTIVRDDTDEQKAKRMETSGDFISMCDQDPLLLKTIVTRDEAWCYQFDPESKQQSMSWCSPTSPRPKKAVCKNPR
ncbi:hypothetical protein ANN_10121 [Periplaneta americana]|uniref:Mos1 transposase HTH domain-containing protein n=1 Tax=Periplaneta americana TaxID=6978 RepID=A0ABQ8TNJ1_PERAM|nr:hypothetical protein ANN_10121 [Periplaneta americana]